MSENECENDVVVVDARCAGAVTAMQLARLGYRVTVVERGRIPSVTLSTHGIARGGVVQLARRGLLDQVLTSGAPAIRQVVFRTATPRRSVLSSRGPRWTVMVCPVCFNANENRRNIKEASDDRNRDPS